MPTPQSDHSDTHEITRLLRAWSQGDPEAFNLLFPLIFRELKGLARTHLQHEYHQTLQTLDLIQEAYLKLHGGTRIDWNDRGHFFAFISHAMREVLVDHARKRKTLKRQGETGSFDQLGSDQLSQLATIPDDHLIMLDEAMNKLEESQERSVRIVEMRLFLGLGMDEIAEALGVDRSTVYRGWMMARAQLQLLINGGEQNEC